VPFSDQLHKRTYVALSWLANSSVPEGLT